MLLCSERDVFPVSEKKASAYDRENSDRNAEDDRQNAENECQNAGLCDTVKYVFHMISFLSVAAVQ